MGLWNPERAKEARERKPKGNLNDMLKGEVKTFDKSMWKELRIIREILERIEKKA